YVCSAVSDSHCTVYDLLSPELRALVQGAKRGHRLHTIGRLDCDTSGLLLFTTDGQFSHKIAAAEGIGGLSLPKTYRAKLSRPLTLKEKDDYITRSEQGLVLPAEKKFPQQQSAPAKLNFVSDEACDITVFEGKFHEVRRIFRALGNEVARLQRISIGKLTLPPDLAEGDWRELTKNEKHLLIPQ
ncbi:MAG: rRNA pseudouridine synthase, partial [Treponema sp.]|nr:rRNA pseudouridine synthase [Treponema sp.]